MVVVVVDCGFSSTLTADMLRRGRNDWDCGGGLGDRM